MITKKELLLITEKITRRFEIELPLEVENFSLEDENLHIQFKQDEIDRSFELSKGLIVEFDKESNIVGLKINSFGDYLPKES